MKTTYVFCQSISRLFHNIIGGKCKKRTNRYSRTLKCLSHPCITGVRDLLTTSCSAPVEKDYLERAKRRFFLHPRIPLSWVLKLNEAGVAGLRVGYVLIYCFVLKGSNCIKLSNYLLYAFRISKNQKSRGLRELEELGLIEMKINRADRTKLNF